MNILFYLIIYVVKEKCEALKINITRRILRGNEAGETRPYMVYLKPTSTVDKVIKERHWLCSGAIIHPQYILTSAACIEDIGHFYVISGTHRWTSLDEEDECVTNGAKKAVWKCIPKDYAFDGKDFDNIRWMTDDIAVVKVEDEFSFEKRVRGCDFVPRMIAFNNQSEDLGAPGTLASISGWGSIDVFRNPPITDVINSPNLLETEVVMISKTACKKGWPQRYHYIIDHSMICSKDTGDTDSACREEDLNCKDLEVDVDEEDGGTRRFSSGNYEVHSANHFNDGRRSKIFYGGFCENDHGGPLVVGHGTRSTVIGVISACLTTNVTRRCYGPFLYSSVWKNRHIISCALGFDKEASCRRLLRAGNTRLSKTIYDWTEMPKRLVVAGRNRLKRIERIGLTEQPTNMYIPIKSTTNLPKTRKGKLHKKQKL